jgi:tetratricopeptide (TPR) repeat protein/CHAT domain-containing protein
MDVPEVSQADQYLNSGKQCLEFGNYSIALNLFEQSITLNPGLAEAWEAKAATLRNLGRYEEAIAASEKAIALQMHFVENNAGFWLDQGCSLFDIGDFEAAIINYDKAVKIRPDYYEAWTSRGTALFALGKYEQAISDLDKAIVFKPDCENAWNSRGAALVALEYYEDAIASFDKAIMFNTKFEHAWINRGTALEKLEQYEAAITSYDRAIKIQPDSCQAWNQRGSSLAALGQYKKAIDSYDQAIKFKLDFYEAWHNRGHALSVLERYEDAIDSFDNAIEVEPDHYEAWYFRGFTFAKLERYDDAIASFDKTLSFKPDHCEAWFHSSVALFYLERYEDAIVCFDKTLSFNPDYCEAWYGRSTALVELEHFEDAVACFDEALRLKPDYYEAWHGRSTVLIDLGRYEDAVTCFDKVLKIKPDYHESWHNRGMALVKSERFKDAIANFDQGLIHVPKETQPEGWGELHRGQGDVYLYQAQLALSNPVARLRLCSQALKCYQTALQTLETFPEVYLDLIRSLIKTYLGLANPETANQWRIRGLEVFRQLLNVQSSLQKKRRIEAQFSGFSQVSVDTLVSTGNLTTALKAAERYKNRCLTWILDEWHEQVTSPSYAEMRGLLNSNREIIYWHLSEEILTTFILTPNQENPIVLTQNSIHFETWRKDWDKRYGDYRSKGKSQVQHQARHPWRDTLKTELDGLKAILDIEKIEAHLSPHTHLILIPHRDLHRFPIHALFGDDRITTYLPNIKVGLAQKSPSTPPTRFLLNVEDPARSDQPPLQFARLESAIIQAMFTPNVKTINPDDGDRATVKTALQENRGIFHFTGHGDYNARQPEHSAIGLTDTDRLTAKEISALNLQQYELVCLSACETALTGMQTINTEYVGLTSAFLQAGVSQVISTLWTVQEVSNAYLMIRFYQFLQNEMHPAEALKRSQSWLSTVVRLELADWLIEASQLKNLDPLIEQELEQQAYILREEVNASTIDLHHPPYADPYHWAAFTLTGRSFL